MVVREIRSQLRYWYIRSLLLWPLLQIRQGYRTVLNVGPGAGQSVFHLHVHLLGGRTLVPRDTADVIAAVTAARKFGAPVLPRGGGTSLAPSGQMAQEPARVRGRSGQARRGRRSGRFGIFL